MPRLEISKTLHSRKCGAPSWSKVRDAIARGDGGGRIGTDDFSGRAYRKSLSYRTRLAGGMIAPPDDSGVACNFPGSAAMEYQRIELGRRAGGVTRPEQKAAR
jgi:hypothetical protein